MNIDTNEIIARPLAKFFNYEEWIAMGKSIPNGSPTVAEKMDGSLGILYWLDGVPWVATRGSFTSDQALWATEWVRKNISKIEKCNRDWTYLFEIIYPANRIVLNYDFSGLAWLGAVNIETGVFEIPLKEAFDFMIPVFHNFVSVDELLKQNPANREGFVLYYEDTMLKIKFDEYVKLHKIMTGLSEKGVWELLKEKGIDTEANELVENVPDEFYEWLTGGVKKIQTDYYEIRDVADLQFTRIYSFLGEDASRKEYAEKIKTMARPELGFAMLDKKPCDHIIFKLIKPRVHKTFAAEDY
jgi:RNA ligase